MSTKNFYSFVTFITGIILAIILIILINIIIIIINNKTQNPTTIVSIINLLLGNVPILYPLKTPENLRLSGVFWGCKMGTLGGNRLTTDNTSTTTSFRSSLPEVFYEKAVLKNVQNSQESTSAGVSF